MILPSYVYWLVTVWITTHFMDRDYFITLAGSVGERVHECVINRFPKVGKLIINHLLKPIELFTGIIHHLFNGLMDQSDRPIRVDNDSNTPTESPNLSNTTDMYDLIQKLGLNNVSDESNKQVVVGPSVPTDP